MLVVVVGGCYGGGCGCGFCDDCCCYHGCRFYCYGCADFCVVGDDLMLCV